MPESSLRLEIQSVDQNGRPTGTVLATSLPLNPDTVPVLPANPDWRSVQFFSAAQADVTAGTRYAIVATAPQVSAANYYQWWFQRGDPYPRGAGFVMDLGPPLLPWEPLSGDFTFKTYVMQGGVGAPADPAQKIAELRALLDSFGLHHGLTRSLHGKLARALAALAGEDTARACGPLRAFLNHIAAQRGKKLTVAQAQQLSDSASDLHTSLDCDGSRR
jgi:hypothetical protein